MQLPYKPKAVLHRHGGKIIEVTEIRIQQEKPSGGYSRDAWYFMGKVEWADGSGKGDRLQPIDMPCLVAETPEGDAEVRELSAIMMAYLDKHGDYSDEGRHKGWYAHRPEKRRTA